MSNDPLAMKPLPAGLIQPQQYEYGNMKIPMYQLAHLDTGAIVANGMSGAWAHLFAHFLRREKEVFGLDAVQEVLDTIEQKLKEESDEREVNMG